MRNTTVQLFRILIALTLLAVAPVLHAQDEGPEPIKIGLYGPMTGPIAFLGEGFEYGATMAVEDLGGEIEGIPLELVVADNIGMIESLFGTYVSFTYSDVVAFSVFILILLLRPQGLFGRKVGL